MPHKNKEEEVVSKLKTSSQSTEEGHGHGHGHGHGLGHGDDDLTCDIDYLESVKLKQLHLLHMQLELAEKESLDSSLSKKKSHYYSLSGMDSNGRIPSATVPVPVPVREDFKNGLNGNSNGSGNGYANGNGTRHLAGFSAEESNGHDQDQDQLQHHHHHHQRLHLQNGQNGAVDVRLSNGNGNGVGPGPGSGSGFGVGNGVGVGVGVGVGSSSSSTTTDSLNGAHPLVKNGLASPPAPQEAHHLISPAAESPISISSLISHPFPLDYDSDMDRPKKVYKVVLTGGPCGGKTTGQARLCTFFENLGWKVFRVPEAATVLLGGGIKFSELSEDQAIIFQEELLRTMMQIESVYFAMAELINRDVLIICDRGAMDASAFIPRKKWEGILNRNQWNEIELRDTRYNQIIHMVSAANGAEPFYTIEDHSCRSEGLSLARQLDKKAAQSWVGHPYFDVVDNSSDFETKLCRMIQCVCQKLGIDARDRLQTNSKKVKFLVSSPLPDNHMFPAGYQDFTVVHDYLQTTAPKMQARLRKRGQKGNWSYTYTVRRPELQGQVVEVKTALTQRDYNNMLAQRDHDHVTVFKTRRCFLLNDQYFQLDVYEDPCHPRCKGMILLETYSTLNGADLQQRLPQFLKIQAEVTGDPRYSMFNLSLKERWLNNKKFCQSLGGTVDTEVNGAISKSESRLAGC